MIMSCLWQVRCEHKDKLFIKTYEKVPDGHLYLTTHLNVFTSSLSSMSFT